MGARGYSVGDRGYGEGARGYGTLVILVSFRIGIGSRGTGLGTGA